MEDCSLIWFWQSMFVALNFHMYSTIYTMCTIYMFLFGCHTELIIAYDCITLYGIASPITAWVLNVGLHKCK